MADLSALAENLIGGKIDEVKKLAQEALEEGVPSSEILDEGLIKEMNV